MNLIKRIPILRGFYGYWRELTNPAPLNDFADYDVYWEARIRERPIRRVLDRFKVVEKLLPDDASVLDIGCGDGAFLDHLRRTNPSRKVMGIDISKTAVESLKTRGINSKQIDPCRSLASQLDDKWDYIVLMEVVEHIVDAEDLMRQVLELAPKRVYVTIPNTGFILYRMRLMFFGRFPVTSIIYHMKEHVRFWTVKDFHQWAASINMSVLSYHGQVDRPDKIVQLIARAAPSLFASQMVYELKRVDS